MRLETVGDRSIITVESTHDGLLLSLTLGDTKVPLSFIEDVQVDYTPMGTTVTGRFTGSARIVTVEGKTSR